jgi:DNA-binding PadR family transcriptional regulator
MSMTNAELAILSLVLEQPRHGYEIEQVIEERGMREWTEVGFSSIYYVLRKLQACGCVASELSTAGPGPARRVYHITAPGKRAWAEATQEALSVPKRPYSPLQLGLANLLGVPRAQAVAALGEYRQHLAERRDGVKARREALASVGDRPFNVDAMFDLSLVLIEAEMVWVERFVGKLEAEGSSVEDPRQGLAKDRG